MTKNIKFWLAYVSKGSNTPALWSSSGTKTKYALDDQWQQTVQILDQKHSQSSNALTAVQQMTTKEK